MTATVEPGRAEDWEDTGPIPLYTRPSGDTAKWRDRGRIIADLIAERDEARAQVERVEGLHINKRQWMDAIDRAEHAEAEVRDLRAKVAAVEALAEEWRADYPGPGASWNGTPDEWWRELRAALAPVGRTEPAGVGILNCPVCGSGEEGDCICLAAEAIAKAEWERSGRAVYEAPWGQVSDIKRHSLIVKALPAAHEARRTEPAPEAGS